MSDKNWVTAGRPNWAEFSSAKFSLDEEQLKPS